MRMSLGSLVLATLASASTYSARPHRASAPPEVATRIVAVAKAESLAVAVHRPANGTGSRLATSGLTVVLLPGPIGSSFSMRRITSALAERGIASVVIDPLGMGTSSRPPDADYALSRQALRIGAVLDTLGLSRVLLVAQGTSATIALHLAADAPDRVTTIVSLAGGGTDRQGTSSVRLALSLAAILDNPVGRAVGRRKFMAGVRQQSFDAAWCTTDVMRAYLAPFEEDLRGSMRVLRAMHDAVEATPIAARLAQISAPVHVLIGSKASPNMPSEAQLQALARSLSSLQVDTVARSGTMLHEERPETVVQAILSHLPR